MAMTVHCDIVSAEESIFSGRVELVVAAGVLGDLGITPGHAPLLSELQPGPVRVSIQSGGEEIFYVSGGFIEVQPNRVTVLADSAVRAKEIDEAEAAEAKAAAARSLSNQSSEFEYSKAAAELAQAAARLRTVQQLRRKLGA
ncbi:F0F1 ATP synthase subunit epsilon [Oceanospirillum linum]|uniref:ATP synthase epsilon chain n=1 Tax=Oceanospirillum linum TaxID=966 RepID=A0A1T1HC87_OCELI|nr:F0F1 ATP synthase subunit epsilon [Oceanospirillum linum]OOV87350.1 F0F1 ATP synthase subunit epsilon [Oceanospirillum linum]SEF82361.1 ATP synthase F1 subcomplex epsilon subunit [Oleiphilus messinensis]SMP19346.1 ATP synthase F1 subcomplex epsilon subunit [Oceanospirillum linum]